MGIGLLHNAYSITAEPRYLHSRALPRRPNLLNTASLGMYLYQHRHRQHVCVAGAGARSVSTEPFADTAAYNNWPRPAICSSTGAFLLSADVWYEHLLPAASAEGIAAITQLQRQPPGLRAIHSFVVDLLLGMASMAYVGGSMLCDR
eukprot:GHRR01012504.1.p1 GENE.GHRR01012504.1~~GHRR01012504.1.p1  ORF type:complete len:147 (+),score=15.31 GHRR01012504.1:1036-1476(+)